MKHRGTQGTNMALNNAQPALPTLPHEHQIKLKIEPSDNTTKSLLYSLCPQQLSPPTHSQVLKVSDPAPFLLEICNSDLM